jgi:hypothetical protein
MLYIWLVIEGMADDVSYVESAWKLKTFIKAENLKPI